MAEARNYPNHEAGSSLNDDIERWREEFEVEICRSDGDPESDLHQRLAECKKNPGHVDFIPEPEFTIEHLPVEWRDPWVYKGIKAASRGVVHLSVLYTSPDRPDGYPFSKERGQISWRFGTGYVDFPSDFQNKQSQQCPFKNCKVPHPHNVTPEFEVVTASHVVFDSSEAEQTEIRFFFDSKNGTKGKAEITAQGLRIVLSTGPLGERSSFACVSHNLNIRDLCESDTEEGELEPTPSAFDREEKKPEPQFSPTGTKEEIPEQPLGPPHTEEKKPEPQFSPTGTKEEIPEQPLGPPLTEKKTHDPSITPTEEKTPAPPLRDTNGKKRKPLVVIVSHPHGCSKHVSTGYLTGVKSMDSFTSKILGNLTLRNVKEVMRQVGCTEEFLEFVNMTLDKTFRQVCQDFNINFRDFLPFFSHDLALIVNCPFTINEVTHKMLLAMWEKTTSNSTLSGQVSEEKLTEIALSVVNDIISIKSSEVKRQICQKSLSLWKTLTSDSTFIRQLCREEFSVICKHVVNDTFGTDPLSWKEMFEKMCSVLSMPAGPTAKLLGSVLFNEGVRLTVEDNPTDMTLGQWLESQVNRAYANPYFSENYSFDRMLYDTKTCPGTSGAPVFLFYDEENGEVGFKLSTHCGANKGNNISSTDPVKCRFFEKVKQTDKLKQKASQDDIPLD